MPYERKIINDPVFGFINIPKGLLYDIVRHPLLQRLTRIKQVGLSSVVYPGAQHTRFQHSLGAFYLMSEAITQLASKGNFIFDKLYKRLSCCTTSVTVLSLMCSKTPLSKEFLTKKSPLYSWNG
jgi:HD superfamily phosphohydrolase